MTTSRSPLQFYPSNVSIVNDLRQLCGQHFGITTSQIVQMTQLKHAPRMHTLTARFPDYHKILLGEHAEMQYHLSGYGVYREEALVRLLGEAIERYALITAASKFRTRIFKASYNDLKSKSGVLPWDLIDVFSESDYAKMKDKIIFRPIGPDDEISWLWCPSLFAPEREICVPAQCLFTGLKLRDEIPFITSFSKGCASHTDPKVALRSAILEAVEADALMIRWYTDAKPRRVSIDDPVLDDLIGKIFRDMDVEIIPYEFTVEGSPGHVFAVAILSHGTERPTVLLGTGAGLNPGATLYRSLVEAVAIFYIAYNGPALQPEDYLSDIDAESHINLDSNVAYWASPKDGDLKRGIMRDMSEGYVDLSTLPNHQSTADHELSYTLSCLENVSEYAVQLDITPAELNDTDWSVSRVLIPELAQVSLPSFPYNNHPRLKQFGGVSNPYPHPSP